MDEKSSQSQWESHTRDEGRALEKQQSDAGPTHGPVGETVGERLQAGAESAADVERLRCAHIAARWSDPPTFLGVTGPLEVEAARAVQRVVRAIEAEIRGEPPHEPRARLGRDAVQETTLPEALVDRHQWRFLAEQEYLT